MRVLIILCLVFSDPVTYSLTWSEVCVFLVGLSYTMACLRLLSEVVACM